MSIGEEMQKARLDLELTQEQLALDFNLSKQMVSHIEKERRKIPKDVKPKAIETLDSGFFAMTVAAEVTAGAWVTRLNGENIDDHRSSVRAKTVEELHEAIDHVQSVCIANHPRSIGQEDRQRLEEAMIQCIDAIFALSHYIAAICRDYGFSWVKLWLKHKAKLKARKYMK